MKSSNLLEVDGAKYPCCAKSGFFFFFFKRKASIELKEFVLLGCFRKPENIWAVRFPVGLSKFS